MLSRIKTKDVSEGRLSSPWGDRSTSRTPNDGTSAVAAGPYLGLGGALNV